MPKILVVVPDMTRRAHLKEVLPRLLPRFCGDHPDFVGTPRNDIKIIVATGLHKPHTKEELKSLVGRKIFSNYEVISHDQNKNNLVKLGETKEGVQVVLNKNLFEADYIATVGLIEPHLYAGYSGGAKTIAIGLAGEETINATHHPRFLDKRGAAIGSIKNNPFQDFLWAAVKELPIRFSVNVINDRKGRLKRVFIRELKGEKRENKGKEGERRGNKGKEGERRENNGREGGIGEFKREFNKGVRFAKKIFEKRLDKSFDAVICKVSPPKDVNMYQASRAFNYVLNVKRPIVRKGGMVLVCASLRDGFGKGVGEKRFGGALKKMRSPEGFIRNIKKKGCVAGEHRAYMVAKALTMARLGFIGPRASAYTKGLPFLSFPNVKSAIKFIKHTKSKTAKIHKIPYGLSVILSHSCPN